MSTWHQDKNPAGLMQLWLPHPTKWKCISDKLHQHASSMTFEDEAQARAYARKTGDILIPPENKS